MNAATAVLLVVALLLLITAWLSDPDHVEERDEDEELDAHFPIHHRLP